MRILLPILLVFISTSLFAQKNVKDNLLLPRFAIKKAAKQIDDDKRYKKILEENVKSMRFMRAQGCRYDDAFAAKCKRKIQGLSSKGFGDGLNLDVGGMEVIFKQKKGKERGEIKNMAIYYKADDRVIYMNVKGDMSRSEFLVLGIRRGMEELGLLKSFGL